MVSISPFRALRPAAQFAREVASRPYDVLSVREAREEVVGKPNSFLHITRSEIDFPPGIDIYSQEVYQRAKESLHAFISREVLFTEEKPCYYLYELVMDGRSQTGLVCCSSVKDYEKGIIRKHEFTRPEKEQDRINHIYTTRAQTGNVFLAYRDHQEMNRLVSDWKKTKSPVYNFTTDDKVSHAVWVISDTKVIEKIGSFFKEDVSCTYIADGHHRAASAAKVRELLPKNQEAAHFLTTLFPASELMIYDYNRVIKNLNNLSPDQFINALEKDFDISKTSRAYKPEKPHHFGLYIQGNWYQLVSKENSFDTDPVGVLDVSVLQKNVLDPILDIKDQRTDPGIDFVGGVWGMDKLKKIVDEGEAVAAFSIFPVTTDQLFSIADNNLIMPPKSTWFEPKLRDGLLTHLIGD